MQSAIQIFAVNLGTKFSRLDLSASSVRIIKKWHFCLFFLCFILLMFEGTCDTKLREILRMLNVTILKARVKNSSSLISPA